MKTNHLLLSFILILFCFTGQDVYANDGNLYKISMNEKVDSSSLIVFGKVIKCEAYWDEPKAMIYTTNTIQVYSIYKGNLTSETIAIQTVGGRVENDMVTTSSLLTLKQGEMGVFFCRELPGKEAYDVYASKQGFLKLASGLISGPFYQSDFQTCETELVAMTNQNQSLSPIITTTTPDPLQLVSSLNFSPNLITAGTGSLLTLTGTGFGTSGPDAQNYVAFANADFGGAPNYIIPLAINYVSWSDNQIEIIVPTEAGTGPVSVTIAGVHIYSANELTIPYAINNNGDGYIPHLTNSNGSGGMTWTFNSNMNFANGAAAPFNRARNTWKCATGINWNVAPFSTSIDDPVMGDGVNVVARNSLAQGVLGVCYTYSSSCNGGTIWYVTGQDIIFLENWFGNGAWNYSTSPPSNGAYDFESVALHELGHAHVLGHVVENNDVMNWNIANGQMERVLTSENIAAGNLVMDLSNASSACGNNPMVQVFPVGCSESIETGLWMVESSNPLANSTCFGLNDVEVNFANYGFDTITHIDFNWSVNGALQTPVVWNGSLLFNQVVLNMLIGSYSFQDSLYEVVIWADNVNGLQESNQTNDTTVYSFHPIPCTPDDIGLGAIGAINVTTCLSTENITVDLFNAGTNVVTTCRIYFEANGILTDSLDWIGNLNPGDTIYNLFVTTFSYFYPSATLKLWTGFPNSVTDSYFNNDTTSVSLTPLKLSGIYTVGGVNPDFATPNDVFAHLDTYGVCGDVTINIRNGTYPINFSIDSIINNSLYSIVVQSESGNPLDVTLQQQDPYHLFWLHRIYNLTFKNLRFVGLDSAYYAQRISLDYGSKQISFENNIFSNVSLFLNTNSSENRVLENIRIVDNVFSGGNITAYLASFYTGFSSHLLISRNTFYQLGGYLKIEGFKDITINHNHIFNNSNSNNSIQIDYRGDSLNVFNNSIEKNAAGGTALYIARSHTVLDTTTIRVYNNQITHYSGGNQLYSSTCMLVYGLKKFECIHNSFYFDYYFPTLSNTSKALIDINNCDSVWMKNNQMIHEGGGLIYRLGQLGHLNSDYNNYWTLGSIAFNNVTNTYLTTLPIFSSSNGSDLNSSFINPQFISPNYLMPLNTWAMDNHGTPINYIESDFVDSIRNPITPDIGAYEFHTFDNDIAMLDTSNLEDTTFCSGEAADLIMQAFNNGTQPITSFYAYVSMNGIPIDTVLINQTILPQQTLTFFVGNYSFINPVTTVEVTSRMPNNLLDSLTYNDSYTFNVHTQLAGVYTVGDSVSDFETIQLALESLSYGLCGPVVFKLKDGTHDNWGTINAIPNNNSINTITFQSESLDTGAVSIAANVATSKLILNEPQYLTFKHLKFATHGTFTVGGIGIKNVSELTFDSCKFINSGINYAPNFTTYTNGITVKHSHLISSGIYLQDEAYNTTITDNLFEGSSRISLIGFNTLGNSHPTNIMISENVFNCNGSGGQFDGLITLEYCENFELSKNTIYSSVISPLRIYGADVGYAVVKNNFIRSNWGGYFGWNSVLKIVNNSFRTGTFQFIGDNYIDFKNNIVFNTLYQEFFIFTNLGQMAYLLSDYNLFYGNSGNNFAYSTSTGYISYNSWRGGSNGQDQHSITGEPNFVGLSDLHVNSILADSNGISLPYVTDDIDNETRSTTHPDIGADEFDLDLATIFDIGLDSLIQPISSSCVVGNQLIVSLTNHYSEDLTNAHFTWTINASPAVNLDWNGFIAAGQTSSITLATVNFTPGLVYTITVTVTNPNGQTDWNPVNNTFVYYYIAYKEVTILANQNFICGSQPINLSTSITNQNTTHLWSNGSDQSAIQVTTPGIYWLQATNQYGCVSIDSIDLISFPAPYPVTIYSPDTAICIGETVVFTATPILNGSSYSWSSTAVDTSSITVFTPSLIILTTTDSNGCVTTDQQQLYELNTPNSSFILVNDSILQSAAGAGLTFQWLLNGTPIPGATGSTYTVNADGVYSLITTNSLGCSDLSSLMTVNYSTIGLQTNTIDGFYVFPNPSTDYFVLEFTQYQAVNLILFDVLGRKVREVQKVVTGQLVNVSTLQAGTYYLEVNGQKNSKIRLIKL